jgi:NTP pyrophosphatase (non-canonical NTP hydrolase)
MDFDYYQNIASGTDQNVGQNTQKDEGLMIPLLGIAGETGTLLAEFKKKIRDKDSYECFQEKAEEELGDILWYLPNIATRMGLSLSEIASKKLQKTSERWPTAGDTPEMFMFFDEGYLRRRPSLSTGELSVRRAGSGGRLSLGPQRQSERGAGKSRAAAGPPVFFSLRKRRRPGKKGAIGWSGGGSPARPSAQKRSDCAAAGRFWPWSVASLTSREPGTPQTSSA